MSTSQESLLVEAGEPRAESTYLPGDLAMWFFILAELAVFGLLFVSLAVARAMEPEVFAAGARTIHASSGLVNTLVLLTGSYFVARAVGAIRTGAAKHCALWLNAGAGTGLVYVLIKFSEYFQLAGAGYTLRTSTFHFFYFFLTFFHLMHVVLGMVILIAVARRCRLGIYDSGNHRGVESGAIYWHMVDLVWLVLFPSIYVLL